ncbi:MAG: hypothetical protein IKK64_03410 [Bacteroidales bacterium]|nr:hypothetical protein [Bacteroidales bacterium]
MKRYKTNRGNLSSLIRVEDKSVRIKFVASNTGEGYFETNDPVLQKAIEEDVDYGIKFFAESSQQEEANEIVSNVIVVDTITTWQEARKYLQEAPFNVPTKEMTSPKKIKEVAQRFNLLFKNLE